MSQIKPGTSSDRERAFNWLILLGLIVVGLAVFTMLDYGNSTGKDDWIHVHKILVYQDFIAGGKRSLKYILMYPYAHLFGVGFPAVRLALAAARIVTGYLVFRLVKLLRPSDQWFAVVCGILSVTFFVRDTFQFESIFFNSESLASTMITLLALVLLAASLYSAPERRVVSLLLAATGAGLAWASIHVRETPIPVLIGLPILWMVFRRQPWRDHLAPLGIWYAGVIAGTLPTVWPILTGGRRSYSTKLFTDLQPDRLLTDSIRQFDFAFRSLPLIPFDQIGAGRVYLIAGLVCVAAVLIAAYRWLPPLSESGQPDWKTDSAWIFGGLAATWLSFAAFLVTHHARSGYSTHMLAQPAEAVLLASVVWLVTGWMPRDRSRLAARLVGVLLISLNGMVIARQMQVDLQVEQEATWENISSFMRTLGSIAPDSDGPIVFVYLENKPQEETPFVYGWGFQYAVRYFFEDRATGIHTDDNTFDYWEVRDDGIWFEERDRSYLAYLYDWQHVIFITRTDSGEIVVLDRIPEEYATPERQAQYQPYASIQTGYVPARIQENFPIVRPPDPVEKW